MHSDFAIGSQELKDATYVHQVTVDETAHDAAETGHVATDKWELSIVAYKSSQILTRMLARYGNSLVEFDPKAEARLRMKTDLYIVPTVALLYLFCFIDRANVGYARFAGLEKTSNSRDMTTTKSSQSSTSPTSCSRFHPTWLANG